MYLFIYLYIKIYKSYYLWFYCRGLVCGWQVSHCNLSPRYCENCMLDPGCGFCYLENSSSVYDSSCIPVNQASTEKAAWGRSVVVCLCMCCVCVCACSQNVLCFMQGLLPLFTVNFYFLALNWRWWEVGFVFARIYLSLIWFLFKYLLLFKYAGAPTWVRLVMDLSGLTTTVQLLTPG